MAVMTCPDCEAKDRQIADLEQQRRTLIDARNMLYTSQRAMYLRDVRGVCCENGYFGDGHDCLKQPDPQPDPDACPNCGGVHDWHDPMASDRVQAWCCRMRQWFERYPTFRAYLRGPWYHVALTIAAVVIVWLVIQ